MEDTKRIEVTFGVDVDMALLEALKERMSDLHPGSAEYSVAYDQINNLYKHFLLRLDGECAAYMNIAKEQAKGLFGV